MVVWECALIGKHALESTNVAERVRVWLGGVESRGEVPGLSPAAAGQDKHCPALGEPKRP